MTTHFRGDYASEVEAIGLPDIAAPAQSGPDGSNFYRRTGKRVFDVLFVVLTAPFALTLIGFGALLAMVSGVRPFYTQKRLGKDGEVFHLLKIRSMFDDAESLLGVHLAANPAARQEWDDKQKLEHDPRITRFGHFLRRTSLDEMPQLWNVLKGDMSIVGPRPIMIDQARIYPGEEYYALRPGITGPWQISDRSQGSFCDRADFDRDYFESVSLVTDLGILWKTVGAVLRCTGR